ncbi:MAG: molybdenum cofactor guanylyltransferase [Desulfobacterales bacterium]|nr:molybdenum cofactor guanylyltransferase [Desulfobacterales bacterium]
MVEHKACTGVILAGGLNTRFDGRPKALLEVEGERLLDRIGNLFKELFDEILLVTNDPVRYLEWGFDIVTDIYDVRSSLTGIHTGLFHASHPFAFFTACDTPFLKKSVVEAILEGITDGIDVVMPKTDAGYEPLCAAYSTRCLDTVTRHLEQRRFKIDRVFRKYRIRTISEKVLRRHDPELISFFNINAPSDLDRAKARLEALRKNMAS